jgi:hypothetical protein
MCRTMSESTLYAAAFLLEVAAFVVAVVSAVAVGRAVSSGLVPRFTRRHRLALVICLFAVIAGLNIFAIALRMQTTLGVSGVGSVASHVFLVVGSWALLRSNSNDQRDASDTIHNANH